jgi:hypothetical protein
MTGWRIKLRAAAEIEILRRNLIAVANLSELHFDLPIGLACLYSRKATTC